MDAVKFIEERNRMCGTMREVWGVDAEQIVKNTEEWSAAHLRKTRQDVFLEQWPEAMIESDGVIAICPTALDKSYGKTHCSHILTKAGCDSCRSKFWGEVVE